MTLTNTTRQTVVCPRAMLADTSRTRLFGLLGRSALAPGTGLWIRPSSGVHTWGMAFPIDILALGRELEIVGLWSAVGPWKVRGLSWRTRSVLELPAGSIEHSRCALGDRLEPSGTNNQT